MISQAKTSFQLLKQGFENLIYQKIGLIKKMNNQKDDISVDRNSLD